MPPTACDVSNQRLHIHDLKTTDARAAFAADVGRGLQSAPKQLSPKYFYDELGSQLFEAICLLPEYYLTRAENEIFARDADEIVNAAASDHAPLSLIEFGSGSAVKTRRLIESLLKRQPELMYLPIDISASALETSARVLLQSYPQLRVEAYASDYDTAITRLGAEPVERGRTLALFLGSNIGNFTRSEAETFLRHVRGILSVGDSLLLGADLKKDKKILEAAYDDALGITAAFNLNLLVRLNREFDANFNLRNFRHVAFYNEREGRIEIYIESLSAQVVHLPKLRLEVSFAVGERIHTENSHKYDLAELNQLASHTGFRIARTWTDEAGYFSSNLLVAVEREEV